MNTKRHVLEETLDAYLMGTLQQEAIDQIDDHVLVCEHCQQRLAEMESFQKATRTAAGRIRREDEFFRLNPKPRWQQVLHSLMARPAWALAGVAALGALFFLPISREQTVTYYEVSLRATRGAESSPAQSLAGTRLRLRLDTADLAPAADYQVVIVSSEGKPIWQTRVKGAGPKELLVPVEMRIDSGTYWVRLMDPSNGKLLREFPLLVS